MKKEKNKQKEAQKGPTFKKKIIVLYQSYIVYLFLQECTAIIKEPFIVL